MKNTALIQARKHKGMTQGELAKILGYSKSSVSNWENGHSIPSLSDAFKVSEILEEDINHLFSGLKVQVGCTSNRQPTTSEKDTA